MNILKHVALAVALIAASGACAYEYRLQYTPNAGAQGLAVAGYAFNGETVVGNCSYYTESSGSGKGGGYHSYKTYYTQTCTWDMYGTLLTVATGAPTAPSPLYTEGTETVYAVDAGGD